MCTSWFGPGEFSLAQLDVEAPELVGLWAGELVGMLVQNYGWVGWLGFGLEIRMDTGVWRNGAHVGW